MKKTYYIDTTLFIIFIILLGLTIKNINNFTTIAIFLLFLFNSIYINLKLKIVKKYSPKNKLSVKEKIDSISLILGKILCILLIILKGIYLEDAPYMMGLVLFIFHSWTMLDYSYIYQECLVLIRGQTLPLKDIVGFEVERRFIDQVYLCAGTKEREELHFCLSQREYEDFRSLY